MSGVKGEALRYMGHKGQIITPEMDALLDDVIEECEAAAVARRAYRIFDINTATESVTIKGTDYHLTGADICKHLQNASKCALMAVTLGSAIDNLIRLYSNVNVLRLLMVDAVCSALIEEEADSCEELISADAAQAGLTLNSRYSPGYGDMPLSDGNAILALLNASRQIGLTITSSNIMIPRKSVTAVIGLFAKDAAINNNSITSCDNCSLNGTCNIRKTGGHCGKR